MVTDAERVIRDLVQGNFRLTFHAQERMNERSVTSADIAECGRTGKVTETKGRKFEVKGSDLDGDSLKVICVWEGETLVITVF